MKHKWQKSAFCIGSLALFAAVSGFRTQEPSVPVMFDTSSEYMVLSILENEMEVLRGEEKNVDVSELPEYVLLYPELYAPKEDQEGTGQGNEEEPEGIGQGNTKEPGDKKQGNTKAPEGKEQEDAEEPENKGQNNTKDPEGKGQASEENPENTDPGTENADLDGELKDATKKIAYLTFDDGPSEQTALVLDILKEEGIHATFFLVGAEITEEREEIVRRMVEEGHTVGLHTYCHDYNIIYHSVDNFLEDYEKLYKRIYEVAGIKPVIFRFPGGSTNRYAKAIIGTIKNEMQRRGFTYFDWNVSAEDMVGTPTRYSIRTNIFKDVFRYDEPVILMHDAKANELTVSMLKDIIGEIRKSGYDFDTLDHRDCCQF